MKKYTPLQKACLNHDTEALKTIIASGKNINVGDELYFVRKPDHPNLSNHLYDEILEDLTLIDKSSENVFVYPRICAAIHIAVYKGYNEILEIILAAGADLNVSFEFGCTPLHITVAQNNFIMTKKLLDAGADPNMNPYFSPLRTPLHIAAILNIVNMAKLLLDHGANPNAFSCPPAKITTLHFSYKNEELFNLFFSIVNEEVLASFFNDHCHSKNIVNKLLDKIPLSSLVRICNNHKSILSTVTENKDTTILLNLIAAGATLDNTNMSSYFCGLYSANYLKKIEYKVQLLLNNYCPYRVSGKVLKTSNNNPHKPEECYNCGGDLTVNHKNRTIHRYDAKKYYYFCGEQQISSLQEIARYNIRNSLMSNNNIKLTLKQTIELLPLPTCIKDYIYTPLAAI